MDQLDQLLLDLTGTSSPTQKTVLAIPQDINNTPVGPIPNIFPVSTPISNSPENVTKSTLEGAPKVLPLGTTTMRYTDPLLTLAMGGDPSKLLIQKQFTPAAAEIPNTSVISPAPSSPKWPLMGGDSPYQSMPTSPTSPFSPNAPSPIYFPTQRTAKQQQPSSPQQYIYTCEACLKPIQGQTFTSQGKYYHAEHFRCQGILKNIGDVSPHSPVTPFFNNKDIADGHICGRPLALALHFYVSGLIYCERCYHETFSPKCEFCKEPIKDRCINALNKSFHPEHFFCGQCGSVFNLSDSNGGYMEYNGKAYCKEDYATLFANLCSGCDKPLLNDYLLGGNGKWHQGCFGCTDCHVIFKPNERFFEYLGKAYCETHYNIQKASICANCNKAIVGKCINVLGKRYHEAHFYCNFCKKLMEPDGKNFKGHEGKLYCYPCHLKLF